MFVSTAQAAEAAGHHAAEGGFFSDPEVWVAITFLIVIGLLFRPFSRALLTALDLRRDKIRARIEEAERLRTEAQETLAACQKKQRDALKEAESIVAQAKAEAERIAAQAARDLEVALKRREQQAIERIVQAEADAVRDVRNTAIDIAVDATRRLIGESLPAQRAGALIDAAIRDLPNRLS